SEPNDARPDRRPSQHPRPAPEGASILRCLPPSTSPALRLQRERAAIDLATGRGEPRRHLLAQLAHAAPGLESATDGDIERLCRWPGDARGRARDPPGPLAADCVAAPRRAQLRQAPSEDLLVPLGELAADPRLAVAECQGGRGEESREPAARLEEDERT